MVPEWYEVPVFYFSNPNSLYFDGESIPKPEQTEELDFELEIAAVVGREVSDLPNDETALDCLAGFTIYNDLSARDLQRKEMKVGLGPAKGKDFANAFGPMLATMDELRDRWSEGRLNLEMSATVNGREISKGNASSMYWSWPDLISHASRNTRLVPGDVIGSGTLGGGCILERTPEAVGGWLKKGDIISLSIERIGTLTNTIV